MIDELSEKYEDVEQEKIKYNKSIQKSVNKILHQKDVDRRAKQQRVE